MEANPRTSRRLENRPLRNKLLLLVTVLAFAGCNVNSSQNKFALAERLEEDKKYDAAINEYQEVVNKEPYSELGMKALLKIAETQQLYLGRAKDARVSYQAYLRRLKDENEKRRVTQILAKMAFEDFEDFPEAIRLYRELLASSKDDSEKESYQFQIGRAYFLQNHFSDAISAFNELKTQYPSGHFALRADLESANAMSAGGHCKDAIPVYERVMKQNNAELTPLAGFAEASCFEELDDLDRSYEILEKIRSTYPSPQVVELKMTKIKRRKILRKR